MAKQPTQAGIIDSKTSSLTIYNTTNSNKKNKVGTVKKGTSVTIIQQKTVSGIQWAKIKGSGFKTGWVIMKGAGAKKSSIDTSGTASKAKKTTTTSNKNTAVSDNPKVSAQKSKSRATTGVVKFNKKQYGTGEVTRSFPALNGFKNTKNVTKLKTYEITYDKNVKKDFETIRRSINLDSTFTPQSLFQQYTKYYNRFKLVHPDDVLTKTFAHVFFTRPDLNIMKFSGSSTYKLTNAVSGIQPYQATYENHLDVMKQLILTTEYDHDFMLYPSNRIVGFETRDRNIGNDTYGRALTGHSIAYGKHDSASKSAGELSLTFTEDRYLHIYNLHNLWVSYISDCYEGYVAPDYQRILDKELDYASSLYYIVTDETGENIIYWAKYYGVFPTTVPDSSMGWTKGSYVTNPEVTVTYQYSFWEPLNIETLYELNLNTRNPGKWKYARTYQPDLAGTGTTWVGAPFVEMVKNGKATAFKLRFLEKS